jgi:hypothetical protein
MEVSGEVVPLKSAVEFACAEVARALEHEAGVCATRAMEAARNVLRDASQHAAAQAYRDMGERLRSYAREHT